MRIRASTVSHVPLPTRRGLIPKRKSAIQPILGAPADELDEGTSDLSTVELSSSPFLAADWIGSRGFTCTQSKKVRRVMIKRECAFKLTSSFSWACWIREISIPSTCFSS